MSVVDRCQAYRSSVGGSWKQALWTITTALHNEHHPDEQRFTSVAQLLTMKDKPGYWHWLDTTITRLIADPTARLDPVPELPEYDELSVEELLERYEMNDQNFRQSDILTELRYRYPTLLKDDQIESVVDLRARLKDVL